METKRKSLIKTVTWRVIATLATFSISWWITGSLVLGAGIATLEFWVKLVLYYGHERLWARVL